VDSLVGRLAVLDAPLLGATLLASFLGVEILGRAIARLADAGVPIGYTRKIFHLVVFSSAAGVHVLGGLAVTNAFGAAIALRVLIGVHRGKGDPLFRVLARPSDHPRERLLIIVPLLTTAVAGLLAALVAGPVAAVGYLVAGWGDAVGEPVGVRFGRHRYRVPSIGGLEATRSLEGSAAVLMASAAACAVALGGLGAAAPPLLIACVAVGSTLVEAASPHGTDNLTVPLAATGLAMLLMP